MLFILAQMFFLLAWYAVPALAGVSLWIVFLPLIAMLAWWLVQGLDVLALLWAVAR